MKEIHEVKFQSANLRINGKNLHYIFGGQKNQPAILILHGWASRAKIFEHLGQHLATDHFVVIPDLPGCGRSQTIPKAEFKNYATTILELVKELELDKVSIIAHSMGGGIGVEMAILAPKKISQLLLLSTGLNPIKRSLWDWIVVSVNRSQKVLNPRIFWQLTKVVLSLIDNFFRHPFWTSETFYLSTQSDLLTELKKIKISPTVICASDEDEFLPAINQVCQILSIQPTLIKGPGHNWPVLEPHQAADVIEEYV